MDPQATFRDLDDAIECADHERAQECCETLSAWIRGDGFEPDWTERPQALGYYSAYCNRHAWGP